MGSNWDLYSNNPDNTGDNSNDQTGGDSSDDTVTPPDTDTETTQGGDDTESVQVNTLINVIDEEDFLDDTEESNSTESETSESE